MPVSAPTLECALELPSFEAVESAVFRESRGNGFFACSALNPGGGKDDAEPVDVDVSVEYARC